MKTGFGGGGYWLPVNGWRLPELTKFASIITHNMASTAHHDERIAKMTFASVFPHYIAKIEKKGRTAKEFFAVVEWLTGWVNQG